MHALLLRLIAPCMPFQKSQKYFQVSAASGHDCRDCNRHHRYLFLFLTACEAARANLRMEPSENRYGYGTGPILEDCL